MSITRRRLSLDRAKQLADAQHCHATVQEWKSATKVYDNNKDPGDGRPEVAQSLPKIIRFLGTDDAPGASCPHCGAEGRYVHHFEVEGGRHLAAMSGCVKLFPVSSIADEQLRIEKKRIEYEKKGWKGLNQWDNKILDVIEAFYAGTVTEQQATVIIRSERQAAATWRKSRRP